MTTEASAFTSQELGIARDVAVSLANYGRRGEALSKDAKLAFFKRYRRRIDRETAVTFSEEISAELSQINRAKSAAAVAFAKDQEQGAEMKTTDARETRRAANLAFSRAHERQGPAPAESKAEPRIDHRRVVGIEAPALRNLDDPTVLDALRAELGPAFRERLLADAGKIPHVQPHDSFFGVMVRDRELARATLVRAAEGLPIDRAEIEQEASEATLRGWFVATASPHPGMPRTNPLEALAQAVAFFGTHVLARVKDLDSQLEYNRAELFRGMTVDHWASLHGPLLAARRELLGRAKAANDALARLSLEVGSRASAAIGAAGGPEALGHQVREALMSMGRWPGEDADLKSLEGQLNEAAARMARFRTNDPDLPEGPLAKQARADRDALLELTESRRAEVERATAARVAIRVEGALQGEPEHFSWLLSIVEKVPAAFPPGLGESLRPIPLEAALAAGPVGLAWCL